MKKLLLFTLISVLILPATGQRKSKTKSTLTPPRYDESIFRGLTLRNIGPAKMSGRIADIAVDPNNRSVRYVAVSSGNVWKTENAGTTWNPVFDRYGSSSTGVVEIDPNNSNIVWLGTGENNAQRSVGLGDGVYKSVDAGKSWKNMGLKSSEHIGSIFIDPRNSDIVIVASQGSVWKAGGDRGLFKTTDGGDTWARILHVSDDTGISDIIYDPNNPDWMWVSSYQRRRHPGILVAGGPEGGVWHTKDAGKSWDKVRGGLPGGDIGRIGLAISPQKSNVLYALVAGTDDTKGFYRSSNSGANWTKMSDYMVVDAQYYMKIFPDPNQFDRILSVDVMIGITEDGGKTWSRLNSRNKHVDNHDIVFDPADPNYIMVGCDGGIYESWDKGNNWKYTDNIPITQYYRVGIDNAEPFYHVFGGTQDNASQGAPSRSINNHGIGESDWFNIVGGDGFQVRIDPDDPNIIYAESQYAGIVRFDKKSGERVGIRPMPASGEPPLRWHWDAPLLISPHNGQRLYFAANKLFRSDDRGNNWKEISGDLSRQMDRNRMEVMGKVWGIDAVFKNVWTSPMSTIVALDESPLVEGLLYVGTDEGLIQVSENGGETWRKMENFPGVPNNIYVADIHASRTDANTVFAVFNNHKYGDYKPYFYKSTDRGSTWRSISGNLPVKDFGWAIYQDHINKNLLFAGTEYGMYFTLDGGNQWIKFTSLPTIPIRDIEIQKRENDLVAASFGRGFYILDDYSPLREVATAKLSEPQLFSIKEALAFHMASPENRSQGDSFYSSPNPDFGAVFTYFLPENTPSLKQIRKRDEQKKVDSGQPVYYPDWDLLAAERREDRAEIIFTISDQNDNVIRKMRGPASKGIHRVNWNLRKDVNGRNFGPMVTTGTYKVNMSKVVNGEWTDLGLSQEFTVKKLNNVTIPAENMEQKEKLLIEIMMFQDEVSQVSTFLQQSAQELNSMKTQIRNHSGAEAKLYEDCVEIYNELLDFHVKLNGNPLMVEKMELIPPSVTSRLRNIIGSMSRSSADFTGTHLDSYQIAKNEFKVIKSEIDSIIQSRLMPLVNSVDELGISHRIGTPVWLKR